MGKAAFSGAFEEGAGGFGPVVVARGRSGPVVRRRAVYRRRSGPEQLQQEARMKAVGAVWATFGEAEARAWESFGATIQKRNPVNGRAYSPIGYNAFSALAIRLIRMDPTGEVPRWPPVGSFAGDGIEVSVEPLPQPPLQDEPFGEGALVFHSSGANREGVVTELMAERLANVRRKPSGQYKSLAFAKFADGALGFRVPVEAGTYACACRFLERGSGRVTATVALGTVTLE